MIANWQGSVKGINAEDVNTCECEQAESTEGVRNFIQTREGKH